MYQEPIRSVMGSWLYIIPHHVNNIRYMIFTPKEINNLLSSSASNMLNPHQNIWSKKMQHHTISRHDIDYLSKAYFCLSSAWIFNTNVISMPKNDMKYKCIIIFTKKSPISVSRKDKKKKILLDITQIQHDKNYKQPHKIFWIIPGISRPSMTWTNDLTLIWDILTLKTLNIY